jgi:peptidoglycan/xylan/chitin deacetylase (PgdA/CDA1 family)
VSPQLFAEHLEYLVAHGFGSLPLAALVDSLASGGRIPDRTVAITFDDGYISVYAEAFPRLRERGWPFTVFVCPDDLDHRRGPVLTWDQLREMADNGATVASHGMFHRHLQRRLAGETTELWRRRTRQELLDAQRRIQEEIGQAPALFAYPYGEWDEDLRELVRELGWAAFGQQSGPMGALSDATRLPRFPMAGPFAAMETFGQKVSSLPLPVTATLPVDPLSSSGGEAGGGGPPLQVTLGPGAYLADGLAAFASGQGAAPWHWIDEGAGILEVRARRALPAGRSRYNLTAPAMDGLRYYWYSHTWIVGQLHGD